MNTHGKMNRTSCVGWNELYNVSDLLPNIRILALAQTLTGHCLLEAAVYWKTHTKSRPWDFYPVTERKYLCVLLER